MKLADELIANAAYIGTPRKGILAADESTDTIGKRFSSVNVENVESNRRALRELLFTTPGALPCLSGVILVEETLYQKSSNGTSSLPGPEHINVKHLDGILLCFRKSHLYIIFLRRLIIYIIIYKVVCMYKTNKN